MRVTGERLKNTNRALLDHQGQEEGGSPGNRNAGVSTGDHAVLLLGVDHVWINCQRSFGGDYWAGSAKDRHAAKASNHHVKLHFDTTFSVKFIKKAVKHLRSLV